MRHRAVALTILAALSGPEAAAAQTFDVSLPTTRLTVGDPVDIAYTIRIPTGATLLDSVPRLLDELPPDVILGPVDGLRLRGSEFVGRLRVTLLRAGLQNLVVFYVRYRSSAAAAAVDTLESRPLPITIASVLPAGHPQPRDVRQLEPVGGAGRFP
ncbi:MAG TPA: hypothetical protein VIW26_09670, partial [Gemmatimonadales bacterium]